MTHICPVCADFFDLNNIYHCLECNHHYPAKASDFCKVCGTSYSKGYKVIETTLDLDDVLILSKWSKTENRKRGVGTAYIPNNGWYEGGVKTE